MGFGYWLIDLETTIFVDHLPTFANQKSPSPLDRKKLFQ